MPPCYKETNGAGGSEAFARGYGKPPAHSRFTPGQSGNPKGRPKGARNRAAAPGHQENRLQSIILDEAYRGVPVNDGKRQVTIPMAQAVVRSLAVNAAKGSQRAQRLFTTLITSTERERRKGRECELEGAITHKVAWERELERRRRLGIIAEDPLPHPDDIVIDVGDGTVVIKGRRRRRKRCSGRSGPSSRRPSKTISASCWTTSRIPMRPSRGRR